MHRSAAFLSCLLLLPHCVPAQVSSSDRTVTVTASRNAAAVPDQGMFSVDVVSPITATRDDVLAALDGSGITVANFSSVYTNNVYDNSGRSSHSVLNWSFTLTVPFANTKATLDQLAAAQVALGKKGNGMTLSFGLRGTQTSPQALAGQNCPATDLISDARAQAQKIATAAGLSVGAVVGLSGTSVVTPPSGSFSSGTYQPSCTLTVKFALTGL